MTLALARLRHQRLLGPSLGSPADAVRWLGAVQSQDYAGACWALSLRCGGLTAAAITDAFNAGRILRTHVLRPTWHFVAPEDIRWMQALTSPRVHAANAYAYRYVELTDAVFRRARRLIVRALEGGRARTRPELAEALERGGISASGLRLACIVMDAELNALICSGPIRGRQQTYMLLEERVPAAPVLKREEALALLAQRYFASHGPASVQDFSWWSGLTMVDARAGLELVKSSLESTEVEGRVYWGPPETAPRATRGSRAPRSATRSPRSSSSRGRPDEAPLVHLLPNFDEHVVAYRDHAPSLDPVLREALRTRKKEPLAINPIARNGLVVGGWRRTLERTRAVVTTQLLVPLKPREKKALDQAAADFGRFLGMPVHVEPL